MLQYKYTQRIYWNMKNIIILVGRVRNRENWNSEFNVLFVVVRRDQWICHFQPLVDCLCCILKQFKCRLALIDQIKDLKLQRVSNTMWKMTYVVSIQMKRSHTYIYTYLQLIWSKHFFFLIFFYINNSKKKLKRKH